MPRLSDDISDGGGGDDDIPHTPTAVDEADKQVTAELKDDLKKDKVKEKGEAENADEDEEEEEEEAQGKEENGEEADEDNDDDEDDEDGKEPVDEEGQEYIVEAIRTHAFMKVKGRKKSELRYQVKWKGWPEEDNTWEPEEHLIPASRQLLADYHTRIGGRPESPADVQVIKKRKSTASLKEEHPAAEKRSKRKLNGSSTAGGWIPADKNWEPHILVIDTMERDEATNNLSVLIRFKNGKLTKVARDMAYNHCPQSMLRFYERNLTFR